MKVNTLVKYQLKDMKYVFIILYAILIFVNLLNGSMLVINGNATSNSGMDVSSSITFFVVAICCFSETFGMWIQNGISRKNVFKGLLGGTIIIAVICSIADYLIGMIFSLLSSVKVYHSTLSLMYGDYLNQCNLVVVAFLEIIFTILMCTTFIMLGYLIAILFYRAGKFMRIGIAAGLPIFFFGVLPIVGTFLNETGFYQRTLVQIMIDTLLTILGIKNGNPLYLMVTIAVVFMILCVVNYLLIKKTQVRTQV